MARFPKQEANILALAALMVDGLKNNPAVFPAPPVIWVLLTLKKALYYTKRDAALAAAANGEAATTAKNEALETLTEAMKTNLRYAENTTNFDDDKLKLIGWAGKKARTALTAPGQTRLLEAPKQGAGGGGGWVFLDWKAPADGGKPAAYKVQRRERPSGDLGGWEDIATAILTEATLVNQPEKQELEYRIIAINKAGEGPLSNTVMVVL